MNKEPKDLRDMTDEELDQRILELEEDLKSELAALSQWDLDWEDEDN